MKRGKMDTLSLLQESRYGIFPLGCTWLADPQKERNVDMESSDGNSLEHQALLYTPAHREDQSINQLFSTAYLAMVQLVISAAIFLTMVGEVKADTPASKQAAPSPAVPLSMASAPRP
jgi:hypothetical protein